MKLARMRYCFNCGSELGCYAEHDPLDNCGRRDCQRAVRDVLREERASAHDRLDREMGWL